MTHPRLSILASLAVATALAAPSARAFVPDATTRPLEFPLTYESSPPVYPTSSAAALDLTRSAGLAATWQVQTSPRTGLVHAAWGGAVKLAASVTSDAQADALSRSFLLTWPDLVGAREDNLQLRNVRHERGKYAVHYRQVLGGTAVRNADAWVLMDEAGNLAAFGSDFFPEDGTIPAAPVLTASAAVTAAADALGATPLPGRPTDVQLTYVPAPTGELMALTAAWIVTFETETPFGKWESIVDGRNGDVLARRNLDFPVNVVGHAQGDVENNAPSYGYCDGSSTQPYPHMQVSVQGGNTGLTDGAGDFNINHGGSAAVNVTTSLAGPYIDVNRASGLGTDASITQSVTPGTPSTLSFTTGNARRDEMDVFKYGNLVHDFMLDLDPTFTQLDLPVIATVGNTGGLCPGNAWWNIGGGNMNFCEESVSSGYSNTGEMSNVVCHEYGHGVTEMVYSRNGQGQPVGDLHEGNSDVLANFIDRNPDIGIGFFLDVCGPGTGIRTADNTYQWPADNDGGHFGGQIIAGFHWDSWQSMLSALPQAEADSIEWNNWHYARDMGTPIDQPSQVLWNFMVDDDDANLGNGTPHYDHYALAALNHGFTPPTLTVGVFIAHTPLTHTTNDATGYDVVATITSTEAALDPSELKVTYHVNGGADQVLLMSGTGNPDEYSATIPAQNQHSEVEYWISAMDMLANSKTDPVFAPSTVHEFDVAAIHDDLESGASGWTAGIPSDDATTGQWGLFDPVGTQAQPGFDSTPGAGTMCFITGQCGAGYGTCTAGCPSTDLGCNDIDGGTTTLLSPVWDVSSYDQVTVKYDRWYSNNTGADPNNDVWIVDVSNDGGSSWTNVESTTASAATWTSESVDVTALFGTPNQVQLRFIASDLNAGSVVEAGVDEVRVLATTNSVVDAADLPPAAHPVTLALDQNQPNPFSPATTIRFALPERSDVRIAVYDVTGRAVRELTNGPREAGRYSVSWNGRDNRGNRVAAGVYFYRLTAGSEVLTRKMTVLK